MSTTDQVCHFSVEIAERCSAEPSAPPPSFEQLAGPVRQAILCGRRCLLQTRRDDGSWCGRQFGDVSLPSQMVLLLTYMGDADAELAEKAAMAILDDQRPDGGWSLVPDGPFDVSVSVQAYFALKVAGQDANDPCLSRARQAIRQHGGADACDFQTRLWLALLGQIEFTHCRPSHPTWAIVCSLRPTRRLPPSRGVRELFLHPPDDWPVAAEEQTGDWNRAMFLRRRHALKHATTRLIRDALDACRCEKDWRELVWQMVALYALGYGADRAAMAACRRRLQQLVVVDQAWGALQPQPATSSRADTALAIDALQASGVSPDVLLDANSGSTIESALRLSVFTARADSGREVDPALPPAMRLAGEGDPRMIGDWRESLGLHLPNSTLTQRLTDDLLFQQNTDGGWSPVPRSDRKLRACGVIRSADCVSSARASSPDATGAALEALSRHGLRPEHRAIGRGIAFLRSVQQADGRWNSATGVQWIHGTAWAVRGLAAAGVTPDDPAVGAGVNWLLVHQHPSGGWGESARPAPEEHEFNPAAPSAIQTAWALLALVASGRADHAASRRGIQFLLDTQEDDGRWPDLQFTLQDPASRRWYRNELHSVAVPLLALARWVVAAVRERPSARPSNLRLVCDASFA